LLVIRSINRAVDHVNEWNVVGMNNWTARQHTECSAEQSSNSNIA